jgi:mycoredoxin-dependent peroxiredoxin
MPVEVGQAAPDFTLTNQYGQQVTLSDYLGKKNVVLTFYPAAFTGLCTAELCTLRDRSLDFDNDDTVVIGVSCDRVPSLKMFATQEGIDYPLLSDFWPHGDVSRAYGVFMESHGISTRGTFVIDKDGILRWSVINGPGEARDADEIAAAVAALG